MSNIICIAGISATITSLLCAAAKDLVAAGLFAIVAVLWYICFLIETRGRK